MEARIQDHWAINNMALITEYLGSILSMEQLCAGLAGLVPLLGTGFTALLLNEEQDKAALPGEYSVLACAIDARGNILIDSKRPRRILSTQLYPIALPGTPADSAQLIVQALYKADSHFGFLVTQANNTHPAVQVSLRDHISEVLFNIAQVEELDENRQNLEEALSGLSSSERKYRELIKSLPCFVMETSANGRIEYLNDLARRLLGLTDHWQSLPLHLSDLLSSGAWPLPYPEDSAAGYEFLSLSRSDGSDLKLLVRRARLAPDSDRLCWTGFDYRSTLESIILPDRDLIEEYGLTRREREVLALELRGLLIKEIASELCLSPSTVKGHLGLVYRKMGVGSRDQLFRSLSSRLARRHSPDSLAFALIAEALK